MLNVDVKVGEEILFVSGREDRAVSFSSSDGKIILCKHNIPCGYARIKTIEERTKCYLVTAEPIIKDIYGGIDYETFLKVLPLHGFKIGYDMTFTNCHNQLTEHQIFAYHLETGCVIVAETWSESNRFNAIDLYCPNVSVFGIKSRMLEHGGAHMSVFNLAFASSSENVLKSLLEMTRRENKGNIKWKESVSLWHYSDSADGLDVDENGNWALWENTIDRILIADSEVDVLFSEVDRMKPILAKREVA